MSLPVDSHSAVIHGNFDDAKSITMPTERQIYNAQKEKQILFQLLTITRDRRTFHLPICPSKSSYGSMENHPLDGPVWAVFLRVLIYTIQMLTADNRVIQCHKFPPPPPICVTKISISTLGNGNPLSRIVKSPRAMRARAGKINQNKWND